MIKTLLIDWRRKKPGLPENFLITSFHSNNGNWQWAAGNSCDACSVFQDL
jgi:deoxyribodipyrimidine photolyase